MKKICFLFAMYGEAKSLIAKYDLKEVPDFFAPCPPRLFRGEVNGTEVEVVLNGLDERGLDLVGCEPATLSAQLIFSKLQPDLLINAGTCGGFIAKGAAIGEVYLSHEYINFHDRRIGFDGDWYKSGVGYFPCMDATQMAADLGFKLGHVTTGSSLDMLDKDLEYMQANNGELKEMEAAAIAWVASLYKKPLLCIKSVTDLVDGGRATEEEFRENLAQASEKLREACFTVLDYLVKK